MLLLGKLTILAVNYVAKFWQTASYACVAQALIKIN